MATVELQPSQSIQRVGEVPAVHVTASPQVCNSVEDAAVFAFANKQIAYTVDGRGQRGVDGRSGRDGQVRRRYSNL